MKAFNLAALVLLSALGLGISRATWGTPRRNAWRSMGASSDVKDGGLGYNVVGDRAVTFS